MGIRVYRTSIHNVKLSDNVELAEWFGSTKFIIEGQKTNTTNSRYPSNCIVINELELYDRAGNIIPYTTTATDFYFVGNGTLYWTNGTVGWDRSNLNDGTYGYGPLSSTLITRDGVAWGRFLVTIPDGYEVDSIKYWVSSTDYRIPEYFRVYAVPTDITYNYTKHIRNRDTSELIPVWEHHNDYTNIQADMVFSSKE